VPGHNPSAVEAAAWVEAGRPDIEAYTPCDAADVPAGVRFDTPRIHQGQICTTSYGTFGRSEADRGSPYMTHSDASTGVTTTYRLAWIS